jgi:5-methylthioadenosine/S-adenosylhomocysteine deaminase
VRRRLDAPAGRPTSRPAGITDVTVWTGTTWVDHQGVVLRDGAVHALRPHDPAYTWRGTTIDGTDAHLVPGFTNTHTHLQQSLCRGVGEGQPLLAWLLAVGETMAATTPERAYVATVSAALEGLLSGTTTLVEHGWPHRDPEILEAVRRGLDDVGVRATIGVGVADRGDPTRRWGMDPRLLKPLEETLAEVDALHSRLAGSRLEAALAVPNPRCLTIEGMKRVRAFADERGLTTMIHLAETGTDDAMCREHAGAEAIEVLAEGDFLGERLLAVHGVELTDRAIASLASAGAAVAWNPVSNMRLGSGVAPVQRLLADGVAVGLGVDGAGSNDRQDMLETLRSGAYVQRATHQRADIFDFATMMRIAVDGAATTLGQPAVLHRGGVHAGRRADLTVVRFGRDFACLPVTDPGASLLTTATPRVVDTVLVDGEVVVADGRSTRIDTAALTEALRRV